MDEPKRRVSLVGPVILIGLGVIFLLSNMGLLAWSVWEVIFRLWPILLVALGLEIILSRLSAWGSLLAIVVGGDLCTRRGGGPDGHRRAG
ncbi:MAG: LiaI-LiaF-like domain-containing protein [Anaerolineae bacterium]